MTDNVVWKIEVNDSTTVVPFLHRQRLEAGFTPLVAFNLPNWTLKFEGQELAQCVTDQRILCLARSAWTINAEALDVQEYNVADNELRELALAGKDLLGYDWPKPKLPELTIDHLFRRIEDGESLFSLKEN